jgi:hypothetical protein
MRVGGDGSTTSSTDWSDSESVQRWLEQQPRGASATMAARAALRVLPLLARDADEDLPAIALPIFRASAVSWAAARYPYRRTKLRLAAASASAAASRAAADAGEVAAAAANAAANANACLTVDSGARNANAADAAAAVGHAGGAVALAEITSSRIDVGDVDDAARIDATFIDEAHGAPDRASAAARLAGSSLWLGDTPEWAISEWAEMRGSLLAADEDWHVWTRWYEDRLAGVPSLGEAFDIAVATLPNDLWKQGPTAVNAEIHRLIQAHTPPEPIPTQGEGIPASHALEERTLGHWFETQAPEVAKTLAARAALRALPLIVAESERPGFEVLPFFRIARATWVALTIPNDSTRAAVSAALQPISENSDAGSAVTRAAAAILPRNRNNVAQFAAGAIGAAVRADSAIAEDTLAELLLIERSLGPEAELYELAGKELWQGEIAHVVADAWAVLKSRMLLAGDDWDVWVNWYEDRLAGRPSLGEAFEIAVATLPDALWKQGPKAVNAEIKRLIEARTPVDPIPAQGAGPHIKINAVGKIDIAPLSDIDIAHNNLGRIQQLLPIQRQAAGDLAGYLNPNTQPELVRIVGDYRAAITGDAREIAWGTVFGLGVRLDNTAAAARRRIEDRLQPPLEDAVQEALDTVLTLHGPLILATAEGRELSDEADRFRLTRGEQAVLREDAQAISKGLKNAPEIIELPVAQLAEDAAENMGEGPHPERGTVFGLAMIRNIATVLVPAATLGAFAWWIGGFGANSITLTSSLVLRENERVRDAAKALASDYNRLVDLAADQTELIRTQAVARLRLLTPFRDFVTANEEPLRRIAAYSTNLRWMLWYIDFIVRTNGDAEAAAPQVLGSIRIVPGEPS